MTRVRLAIQQERGALFRIAVTLAAAMMLVALSVSLAPHGFYSGDSGVKLIAARNAIAHPTRPFEIDLPVIAGEAAPLMDRFFIVHGDHAHALQSPLFPIIVAPEIALLGTRGAYLLPILSFVVLLPLLDVVRRRYAPTLSWGLLATSVLLLNPLFFYALEFWEHAPAAACAAASTALVISAERRYTTTKMSAAGTLAALAVLLRPEAVWYAVALAAIAIRVTRGAAYLITLGGIGLLFAIANYIEFGDPAGPHAAANLAPFATDWFSSHWQRFVLWLVPESTIAIAGAILIACGWVARLAGAELALAQAVTLIGGAIVAVDAVRGSFLRDSLWYAWPAGVLIFVPAVGVRRHADLWWLASITILGVLASSTHDGGAQWGPRFLLIALPALLPLAAIAAADGMQPGAIRGIRLAALIIILACGVWTTRNAYRELRGTKRFYAQLVDSVAQQVKPGDYLLSNVWWFDQIAAELYGTRMFLFTDTASTAATTLRRLAAARITNAALVWTGESDGESLADAVQGTCFREVGRHSIEQRQLTLLVVSCERP